MERHPLSAQALDSLRDAARTVRRLPERILHPIRRRRARRALAKAPPPRSILVICLGNICRSPYAQADLERRLDGAGVAVRSGGLIRPGRTPPVETVDVAADRGIDLRDHRSRVVSGEWDPADLVVFMDPRHVARARAAGVTGGLALCLGDLDPRPIDVRAIPDPYGRSLAEFRASFERIERCNEILCRVARLGAACSR